MRQADVLDGVANMRLLVDKADMLAQVVVGCQRYPGNLRARQVERYAIGFLVLQRG